MKLRGPRRRQLTPASECHFRWIAPCVCEREQRVIESQTITGETSVYCRDQILANGVI
jgi:hypothetical protein